jgi:hypothetical protein
MIKVPDYQISLTTRVIITLVLFVMFLLIFLIPAHLSKLDGEIKFDGLCCQYIIAIVSAILLIRFRFSYSADDFRDIKNKIIRSYIEIVFLKIEHIYSNAEAMNILRSKDDLLEQSISNALRVSYIM